MYLFSIFLLCFPAFAYDCSQLSSDLNSGQAPSPLAIVCIIARVINVFILFVGIVLIVMIAYSAIKLSLTLGDPKGFKGVQSTWQYIIIGTFVVLGFFAIFRIVTHVLGISNFYDPNALVQRIEDGITRFLQAAGITDY